MEAIPLKCFVSHRPTDPFFFEKLKEKDKILDSPAKEASASVYNGMDM